MELRREPSAEVLNQGHEASCALYSIAYCVTKALTQFFEKAYKEGKRVDLQTGILDHLRAAYGFPNNNVGLTEDLITKIFVHLSTALKCQYDKIVGYGAEKLTKIKKVMAKEDPETTACDSIVLYLVITSRKWTDFNNYVTRFKNDSLLEAEKPYYSNTDKLDNLPTDTDDKNHCMVVSRCYTEDEKDILELTNSHGIDWGKGGKCSIAWGTITVYCMHWLRKGAFNKDDVKITLPAFNGRGEHRSDGVEFTVSTYLGNKIIIHGTTTDTIGHIKLALCKKTGVPACNIGLIIDGNVCDDDSMTPFDYGYNFLDPMRVFYNHYDTTKKYLTLDNKNYVLPDIYRMHGAHQMLNTIYSGKYTLGVRVHDPNTKKVYHFGPFCNVPYDYDCDTIKTNLSKYHNLNLNTSSGVFFKSDSSKDWQKINPSTPICKQLNLENLPYVLLHVQT
jgi:hypothetical protein